MRSSGPRCRSAARLWIAISLLPLALVFDILDGYVARLSPTRQSILGADERFANKQRIRTGFGHQRRITSRSNKFRGWSIRWRVTAWAVVTRLSGTPTAQLTRRGIDERGTRTNLATGSVYSAAFSLRIRSRQF